MGVVLEAARRRGLDVYHAFSNIRHVLIQGVERRFAEVLFACQVLAVRQIGPIVIVGIRAGNDQTPRLVLGPRLRVVERIGTARHVAGQERLGLEVLVQLS